MERFETLIEILIQRLSSDNRITIANGGTFTKNDTGFFVYVATAGTITYIDWNGNTATETFTAGYHPTKLRSVALGTATGVTACF